MPDLPMIQQLRARLESVLLVVDEPVSAEVLARALGGHEAEVVSALREIKQELDQRGSGIDLRESDEGWRFYTRPDNAADVEKLLLDGAHSTLSRAALETLAVVAYRQPVTRAQVSAVRGVNVDGVMRTLTLRGLIQEVEPDEVTGAHRYETTALFLEQLGLDSLADLPPLAPLLPDVDSIIDEY